MKHFENILLAVDLSDYSDVVFRQGLELSVMLNKPFSCVYEAYKEREEKDLEEFSKKFPKLKVSQVEGDVTFEIRKKAKDCDLVILSPSYRGDEIPFFGTVTTHVISSG